MTSSAASVGVPQTAADGWSEAASRSEIHEPDGVGHGATREPATAVPPLPHGKDDGQRVFASPLARRIAADKGIDLGDVKGTGPNGRIVQADVLAYQPAAKAAPAEATASKPAAAAVATPARVGTGEKQVIPLTKMRQTIAARLQQSKQQIPHFYETVEIDMEEVVRLRAGMNKRLASQEIKLSIGDFVARAVAIARATIRRSRPSRRSRSPMPSL